MPVTPEQLFEYANSLSNDSELVCRASVNRSYYAAYHAAKIFHDNLPSGGYPPKNSTGMHETLYHKLKHPTVDDPELKTKSRQIGYMGIELKTIRKNADYDLNTAISKDEAIYALEQAKALIQRAGFIAEP